MMLDYNDIVRNLNCFKNFVLDRASVFGVNEWIAVKSCLISLGLILGCSFAGAFKKLRPLLAVIAFTGGAFAFLKIFEPVLDDLKKD